MYNWILIMLSTRVTIKAFYIDVAEFHKTKYIINGLDLHSWL